MDRWRDPAGVGGSSIAYLLFHVTYHADLAVGPVLAGDEPRLHEWRDRLGLGAVAIGGPGRDRGHRADVTPRSRRAARVRRGRPRCDDRVDRARRSRHRRRCASRARAKWRIGGRRPLAARDVVGPAGVVLRAVGGDRPPRESPRRDGVGAEPARTQPVLAVRRGDEVDDAQRRLGVGDAGGDTDAPVAGAGEEQPGGRGRGDGVEPARDGRAGTAGTPPASG